MNILEDGLGLPSSMRSFQTIPEFFRYRCEQKPKHPAVGKVFRRKIHNLTYAQYQRKLESLHAALDEIGFSTGESMAILSPTRLEWHLMDMTALCRGNVVVPIYPSTFYEQVELILNETNSKVLIVDNQQRLLELIPHLRGTSVEIIISLDEFKDREEALSELPAQTEIYSYKELESLSQKKEEKRQHKNSSFPQVTGDQTATIVYTSGTSGVPKGAVITQRALCTMLENIYDVFQGAVGPQDRTLSFLPLSHVLGRCDSLLHLPFGLQVVYAEGLDHIINNLKVVKPTIMIAVPRIFEKIYENVLDQVANEGWFKQHIFDWASEVSNDYFNRLQQDLAPSTPQILSRQLAYKMVFSKIYERFGGKIRFFVSGGAPLSPEIIKFLRNANLTILEGYGLTETIGPCAVNPIRKQIPGTVGLPIGDVMIKLAEDGEILVKSEALFKGYFKKPEETAESLKDGWFYSGDIGEITQEGHLKITDRKKDIIITAGGKNVAPQKIENMMKTRKYISNCMVIGDRRKFLSAIISIEKEQFSEFFEQWGVEPTVDLAELSKLPQVRKLIQREIDEVNQHLSQYETIKKFIIAPHNISVESGHLTPSLKLKKRRLLEEFSEEVEELYSSH